jgi:hypothetical protein
VDDLVRAAMAKWPHVPACVGWLGLDARGRWWMRDEQAQRAGPFAGPGATPASRGTELRHDKLRAFIHRNYAADAQGRWYFQNGPQRVYVELERTPWVWRLDTPEAVVAHTGQWARYQGSAVDDAGLLYVLTDLGCGLVHTQDMHRAAEWIEAGLWHPHSTAFDDLRAQAGFVLSPAALGLGRV